jgi:hypothetical protein
MRRNNLLPTTLVKFFDTHGYRESSDFYQEYKIGLNIKDIAHYGKNYHGGGISFTNVENGPPYARNSNLVALVKIPDDATIFCNRYTNKLIIEEFFSIEQFVNKIPNDILFRYINLYPQFLQFIRNQSEIFYMKIVRRNPDALNYINAKDQTVAICEAAATNPNFKLHLATIQTPEMCLSAIKRNPEQLKDAKIQTDEICLIAVKKDANVLKYVINKTEEICFQAVKKKDCDEIWEYVPSDLKDIVLRRICKIL